MEGNCYLEIQEIKINEIAGIQDPDAGRLERESAIASFTNSSKKCIFLIEKNDPKEIAKHIENLIRPISVAASSEIQIHGKIMVSKLMILAVQLNNFSVYNAINGFDFKTIGNLVCVNCDFSQKLMQIIVRNQLHNNPGNY